MLNSIKSKIVLKNIIRNIEKNVYLRIVKTNRNLQNKLDISLDTYEEYYNQIEVELIPKKSDLSSENQFINPDYQNKAFFNSSFDEVKKCNFSDNENISKIRVLLNIKYLTSLSDLFLNCKKIEYIKFIHCANDKITEINYMFFNCESLINIDMTRLKIDNVTSMNFLFTQCKSLKSFK